MRQRHKFIIKPFPFQLEFDPEYRDHPVHDFQHHQIDSIHLVLELQLFRTPNGQYGYADYFARRYLPEIVIEHYLIRKGT